MSNLTYEPFLTLEVRNALLAHMVDEGDNECCGLITLTNGEYRYVRRKNIHKKPTAHFRFDKKTVAEVNSSPAVVAFCHSHPLGPIIPSLHDLEVQTAIQKPSVIATRNPDNGVVDVFSFGDHLLDYPLLGREFQFNRFDCLEAVRSEAWQREGRLMPAKPRDASWWRVGADDAAQLAANLDMYNRSFREYGYEEFRPVFDNPNDLFHPKIGDVLLMQIAAPVINHAGVYIGNNLLYQHVEGKKSSNVPVGYFMSMGYIRKWVRHEDNR